MADMTMEGGRPPYPSRDPVSAPAQATATTRIAEHAQPGGRVVIAGTRSGCGKTTVTVAAIAALTARGLPVTSFKCGPDYIDPMFHRAALGVPAHNLDPFFSDARALRDAVAAGTVGRIGVIEGVMGYYDGLGATTRASTFEVAAATGTPAVLVMDADGMAASAGAVIQGFAGYRRPSRLRGVIVNRATPGTYASIEPLIRQAGLVPLGFLPCHESVAWPSRRLGLVAADEIVRLGDTIATLARLAEEHLDLDALVGLAASAPPLLLPAAEPAEKNSGPLSCSHGDGSPGLVDCLPHVERDGPQEPSPYPLDVGSGGLAVRIAVARDEAFCFLYAETLELWERLGAELVFFSPLHDMRLPQTDALYLPGGYPENHAATLSANVSMRETIKTRIREGLPTIAECGGFLYLHDDIDGHPMASVIHGHAFSTPRLQRFGYITLTATSDSLLARAGDTFPAHEFHYYDSTANGDAFTATKASTGKVYPCAHATLTLYAGFPHLYLPAVPQAAERFLDAARLAQSHGDGSIGPTAQRDDAAKTRPMEPSPWLPKAAS